MTLLTKMMARTRAGGGPGNDKRHDKWFRHRRGKSIGEGGKRFRNEAVTSGIKDLRGGRAPPFAVFWKAMRFPEHAIRKRYSKSKNTLFCVFLISSGRVEIIKNGPSGPPPETPGCELSAD